MSTKIMETEPEKLKLEDVHSLGLYYGDDRDNYQPYYILGAYGSTVVKGFCPTERCGRRFCVHKTKVTENTEKDIEELFEIKRQERRRRERWQNERLEGESFED